MSIPLCPKCFSEDVMKNGVARTVNGVVNRNMNVKSVERNSEYL